MKVFLDECVDRRFARHVTGHEVKTARDMGWTAIKNGELPRLAAAQFDVFVTVDRNLAFQQNVAIHSIAIIVLRAKANRLADLQTLSPDLLKQLSSAPRGAVTTIGQTSRQ